MTWLTNVNYLTALCKQPSYKGFIFVPRGTVSIIRTIVKSAFSSKMIFVDRIELARQASCLYKHESTALAHLYCSEHFNSRKVLLHHFNGSNHEFNIPFTTSKFTDKGSTVWLINHKTRNKVLIGAMVPYFRFQSPSFRFRLKSNQKVY